MGLNFLNISEKVAHFDENQWKVGDILTKIRDNSPINLPHRGGTIFLPTPVIIFKMNIIIHYFVKMYPQIH